MNIQGKFGPQYAPVQQIDVHTDTRDIPRACQAQTRSSAACRIGSSATIDAHHV